MGRGGSPGRRLGSASAVPIYAGRIASDSSPVSLLRHRERSSRRTTGSSDGEGLAGIRRGIVVALLGALAAGRRTVAIQITVEGRQDNRHGFDGSTRVREQTLVQCAPGVDRRRDRTGEVSVRCREVVGADKGKPRAHPVDRDPRGQGVAGTCRDSLPATGGFDEVHEPICSLKVPRGVRDPLWGATGEPLPGRASRLA